MASFKPQQRHLSIQGRSFHFVSYEGKAANSRGPEPAEPPMWYLMVEGHRCPAIPCDPAVTPEDLDAALATWVAGHALGPAAGLDRMGPGDRVPTNVNRRANWWGPG